ncbi:hypothetical protein GCM10012275_19280 [Longimycelium tulufanense]|uniref:Uncharacterized protein n=1 Tax=Longimycelium tulufanense TaxID=907463 RepID=A0A8J3FU78_9PSEU|nr:hypothetical protein GCM10012275_19280 [Longimycelium tulufanense]
MLAVKIALFERIRARLAPRGVSVTFGDPADQARTRSVWFGDTTESELEPRALAPGRRKPTDLRAEVTIVASAIAPGDPINAERAVYGLRQEIEAAVLDDFDPGSVPGIQDVRPSRVTVTNGETGQGTAATAEITVAIRAHLYA